MKIINAIAAGILCQTVISGCVSKSATTNLPERSPWIQPSADPNAPPIWGLKDGISVGLWPTHGPRGLIRIYTPYLNQPPGRVMQFIAIEPIVAGTRDLSELQFSRIDGKQGKMMWTADAVDFAHPPVQSSQPAAGIITSHGGVETLSFFILVEPFGNGARPIIKLTIRSDRPHEISLQTFAAADSAVMQSCVLTATMGNYAHLRHLHLKNLTIHSTELYKDRPRDDMHFFPWHDWPASELSEQDGEVTVSATADLDPTDQTPTGWRYVGLPAQQSWHTSICPGLVARVNARSTYWASHASIPGGPSFENFELMSPFKSGQEFRFEIEPVESAHQ